MMSMPRRAQRKRRSTPAAFNRAAGGGGEAEGVSSTSALSLFLNASHGLPLVTYQPLHSASFEAVVWFNAHVWLLSDWPCEAFP
jgi:hypothetical protein